MGHSLRAAKPRTRFHPLSRRVHEPLHDAGKLPLQNGEFTLSKQVAKAAIESNQVTAARPDCSCDPGVRYSVADQLAFHAYTTKCWPFSTVIGHFDTWDRQRCIHEFKGFPDGSRIREDPDTRDKAQETRRDYQ